MVDTHFLFPHPKHMANIKEPFWTSSGISTKIQHNQQLQKTKTMKGHKTTLHCYLVHWINTPEFKYPTFLTRVSSSLLQLNFLNRFSAWNLLFQPSPPRLKKKQQLTKRKSPNHNLRKPKEIFQTTFINLPWKSAIQESQCWVSPESPLEAHEHC